eukprot:Em0004g201a
MGLGDAVNYNYAIGFGKSSNAPGGVSYSISVAKSTSTLSVPGGKFYVTQIYDDLLGYHVEAGHVTSPTSYVAIIGAPRGSNHFGNLFVTDLSQAKPSYSVYSQRSADGHFGFSFAVCDWMTDGYDSLVVGCPLCDNDVGRVYVYLHSGNPANPYPTVQEVTPPTIVAGRFGLSVINTGDLDKDGYDDVAIAAPHDAGGVVYIYRGCESGLCDSPQVIRPAAVTQTSLFGYKLSAKVDVDNNSYPDLSVTDMSGTVYTFRTNPLVVVDTTFEGLASTLNINTDICSVSSFSAACFNFSVCFGYRPLAGGEDIGTFAFSYTLSVDQSFGRVVQKSTLPTSNQITLSRNTSYCTAQYYYFLKPDSSDTNSPITVQLTLQDVTNPLALSSSPQSTQFGGSLTPLLDRFVAGSQPRNIVNQSISLITSCGSGGICVPEYVIRTKKEGSEKVLISSEPFFVVVAIENLANQSGIAPQLFIDVPSGVGIYGGSSNVSTIAGVQQCVPLTTAQFKCSLSLIQPSSFLNLTIPFILDSAILGVNLLSGESVLPTLTINFTIGQNNSRAGAMSSLPLILNAQAQYTVTSSTNEAEYVAYSLTSSSLSGQGPALKYTVKVTNSLVAGTTIPNTTLYIYWPTYFKSVKGQVPLLVVTQDTSPSAPCKHYNTVPQEALRFSNASLPQQHNSTTYNLPSQYTTDSKSFTYGVIVCDIKNLAPQSSVDVIILSQLWSTSVLTSLMLSIEAAVVSGTSLPNFLGGKPSDSVTVLLSPGVKEFPVACFPIWIIIVAVIGGFLCLALLGTLIACIFLIYRFVRKSASYDPNADNPDNDDDFVYKQRTIPPIAGLAESRPTSFQYLSMTGDHAPSQDQETIRKEKEKEMEEELQLQAKLTHTMTRLVKQPQSKEPSEAPSDDPFETTL